MNTYIAPRPSVFDRIGAVLAGVRDWLDERGKGAWIAAMILAFVACWPLGLAILGYMIWSKRMFSCRHRHHSARSYRHGFSAPTGNSAFDAYREETLKRLEDEHREFLDFLQKLREAKDKAEFDQFMQNRNEPREPQA
ncbi:DUF2852 domain-containing protein [Paracoccus kondratievae]|uniref:DUF2852 domain-containing protein n=1 Tax=Paracoccus kondratievae TaxID=135740 RepID=A0AAD3RSC3_9RHOB|nr:MULTISPECIES: DUF2852 domain-containing protein [Paracoccus]QFQ89356.1 DUF2852 domain-containing protein [Paracoccus kondratievae]GLK63268.1 hypothetical protein GCM10017635_07380 [Paracoccus kondratievae]SMG17102.1 Protein of unknown function [Paracoccus sp. J56]